MEEQELTTLCRKERYPAPEPCYRQFLHGDAPLRGVKEGGKGRYFLLKTDRKVGNQAGLQGGFVIVALLRCQSQEPETLICPS